jgi:hypothetical protein
MNEFPIHLFGQVNKAVGINEKVVPAHRISNARILWLRMFAKSLWDAVGRLEIKLESRCCMVSTLFQDGMSQISPRRERETEKELLFSLK